MSFDTFIYGLVDPRSGEIRYIGQTARGMARHYDLGISTIRYILKGKRTYTGLHFREA